MTAPIASEPLRLLAQSDLLLLLAAPLRPGWVPAATRQDDGQAALPGFVLEPTTDDEIEALCAQAGVRDPETARAVSDCLQAIGATPIGVLREEYAHLFDTAGLCPPNETVYIRRDKGAILADIAGFYTAFGFAFSPGAGEKADHVAAELEFVALLLFLLAQAIDRAEPEREAVARAGLHAFVRDHLGEWLPVFCLRLEAAAAFAGHRQLATALRVIWDDLTSVHEIRLDEPALADPEPDGGSPYECDRT